MITVAAPEGSTGGRTVALPIKRPSSYATVSRCRPARSATSTLDKGAVGITVLCTVRQSSRPAFTATTISMTTTQCAESATVRSTAGHVSG